jgi:two-component system cell cycle sensor histidine kinase/response regulator CckA
VASEHPDVRTNVEVQPAARGPIPERFELVFEHAPTGICLVGLDGEFLTANPAMCRMLGYSESELRQRTTMDVTHPDDLGPTNEWLHRLRREHAGTTVFEKRYLHREGHSIWAVVSIHVLTDSAGAPRFFVSHVLDITDRKYAEDVLRESEEKFRIAFENAPMGMSIIGPTGRFLAVNPKLCGMFGYSREELLAITFNTITHPDDIERGNLWVKKMMSGDHSEPEFEKRYLHRDGHIVWGLVRAEWVRNDDGLPRMSVCHVLDITDRKRSEAALIARERQLREAHEIALMGHWQLEMADLSMSWADGTYRLLEFEPGSLSPSCASFLSRIHADDRALVEEALQAGDPDDGPCDRVLRLALPEGRIKHLRMICRPEFDSAGQKQRVSGVLQDISTLRQAEEDRTRLEAQLHRAQKMEAVGYLAGGIAHDFNNLLTAIGGNASLALLEAQENERLSGYLSEIVKGVSAAAELTRQLLTFSRKQVIQPRVLNLNDVVEYMTQMLRRLLGEDLELAAVLHPELGAVRLDLSQAEQVLVNLAVNARDAMRDGGRLTIETANAEFDEEYCRQHGQLSPGRFVLLAVSDTGAGMSENTKQHLFEPFFSTKEPGHGSGLGLAMVYGAVRQNQGHIEVYSELGHGTTFKIYLPRVDEPVQDFRPKTVVATTTGSETILLVEDDARVRALAQGWLSRLGYRVHAYANGPDALAALGSMDHPIDLVVTDVVMPGMNGRVFSDHVKALRPAVKVLFTSGYGHDVIAHRGVLDADVEFLSKPYSLECLAERVRQVLGSPSRATPE